MANGDIPDHRDLWDAVMSALGAALIALLAAVGNIVMEFVRR